MTRINVVPVSELTRQHLVAEYRELPRVPNAVRKHQALGRTPTNFRIPAAYVLGPGHVTFFYDKMAYLMLRYLYLIREMRSRGYNPNPLSFVELFTGIDDHWINFYTPTNEALELNRARIKERLG